jgi:hypothetical protein
VIVRKFLVHFQAEAEKQKKLSICRLTCSLDFGFVGEIRECFIGNFESLSIEKKVF